MNFIAASLLLILCNEEDTFFMMLQIFRVYKLKDLYHSSFKRLKILCFQLDSFTQAYLPELSELLNS